MVQTSRKQIARKSYNVLQLVLYLFHEDKYRRATECENTGIKLNLKHTFVCTTSAYPDSRVTIIPSII